MALQDYYNTGDNGQLDTSYTYRMGQSFTTTSGYSISSIRFKGYRHSTGVTINAQIFATSAGVPTGTALSTGSILSTSMTNASPGDWYEITMSAYTLSTSTVYALVIYAQTDYIFWRKDSGQGYAGGTDLYSGNAGVSWSSGVNSCDFMFETYSGGGGGGGLIPLLGARRQMLGN